MIKISQLKTKAVALITTLTIMFYANWAWAKDIIGDTSLKSDATDTFGPNSTFAWFIYLIEVVIGLYFFVTKGKNPMYLIGTVIVVMVTPALFSMIGS